MKKILNEESGLITPKAMWSWAGCLLLGVVMGYLGVKVSSVPLNEQPSTDWLLNKGGLPYEVGQSFEPTYCLEREAFVFEKGTYQLVQWPSSLMASTALDENQQAVINGDLTPFVVDQQAPQITGWKTVLNKEKNQLTVKGLVEDPISMDSVYLFWPTPCGKATSVLTVPHRTALQTITVSLNGKETVLTMEEGTLQHVVSHTFERLGYGTHTVTLQAADRQGNISTLQQEDVSYPKPIQPSVSVGSATTPPQGSTPTYATVSLPSDNKGAIFNRISTCHSSISTRDCYAILKGAYQIVPTFVMETIEQANYDIVMTGNGIRDIVRAQTAWDPGWNFHGVTFPGYQGFIRIYSSLKGGSNILVHEIGHAYDAATGRPSTKEPFLSIYQTENAGVFPNGGLYASTSKEYFAETFRMYLNQRSVLRSKAPQTAQYFSTLLD